MRIVRVVSALLLGLLCSSVAADYCAYDEAGEAVGCNWLLRTGAPKDPILVFAGLKESDSRSWQLSVLLTLEEWAMLEGNSEVRIDGGGSQALELVRQQRERVTKKWLSESAAYVVTESVLQAIADARDEVIFSFSTAASDPVVITVSPDKLTELSALIAEVREKL